MMSAYADLLQDKDKLGSTRPESDHGPGVRDAEVVGLGWTRTIDFGLIRGFGRKPTEFRPFQIQNARCASSFFEIGLRSVFDFTRGSTKHL